MLPLEDNSGDIISKAQAGLGFTSEALARRAGITAAHLRAMRAGQFIEEPMRRVARALNLGPDALVEIARGAWYPEQPAPIEGFRMITTRFNDMTVNAYLVWDAESRKAVAFDTGADAGPLLAAAEEAKLEVEIVLITHAHVDHVMALPRLLKATGAKAWINARDGDEEDFPRDVETFATGQNFLLGKARIETRLTSGHSAGQTTYVVRGLGQPLAIVGDSLFAGSMGGGIISYADQLRNDREQILTLADNTVLACGHGPLTTVGQEKLHNPFFAA